jgi:hypothetical protein
MSCGDITKESHNTPADAFPTSAVNVYDGNLFACLPGITNESTLNQVLQALGNAICATNESVEEVAECNCNLYDIKIGNLYSQLSSTCLTGPFTAESATGPIILEIAQMLCDANDAITALQAISYNAENLQLGLTFYTQINALDCFSGYANTDTIDELILDIATQLCDLSGEIGEANEGHRMMIADLTDDVVFDDGSGEITTSGVSLTVAIDNSTPGLSGYIVNGNIVTVDSTTGIALTATRDNYIDVSAAGVYVVSPVPIGDPAPALAGLRLYKCVTNGSGVTSTVDLRNYYYYPDGSKFADDFLEVRHIPDDEITSAKLADIIAAGSLGDSGIFQLTYNAKGQVTGGTSKFVITAPTGGDVLAWNNSTAKWVNQPLSSAALPAATEGDIAFYNGAAWAAHNLLQFDTSKMGVGFGSVDWSEGFHVHGNQEIDFAISINPITSSTLAAGGTLAIGTTFYYAISYVDASGNESYISAETSKTTDAGNRTINLVVQNSKGAASMRVWRGVASGVYTEFKALAKTATTLSDEGTLVWTAGTPPALESSKALILSSEGIYFGAAANDDWMCVLKSENILNWGGLNVVVNGPAQSQDIVAGKFEAISSNAADTNIALWASASNGLINIGLYSEDDVCIGVAPASKDTKAILDVQSTTKGIKFPNMDTTQRDAMSLGSGNAGIVIFNTSTSKHQGWNGSTWTDLY